MAPGFDFPGPDRVRGMDTPLTPPDPKKILALWQDWEKGEVEPGRLISNLKTAGLPVLLEQLADEQAARS